MAGSPTISIITDMEPEQEMVLDEVRRFRDRDDEVTVVNVRRTRDNPDAEMGL